MDRPGNKAMSQNNLFQKILIWLKLAKSSQDTETSPSPANQMLVELMGMVENTDENELACDEVFALLDYYVELELRGEDVARLLPLVKKHLEKCRDCREEYEALMRMLNASTP